MRVSTLALAGMLFAAPASAAVPSGGALAPPTRVDVDGRPIDVEVGHAAPLLVDWDGDGKLDLLVGQFGEGKLRVYRNIGDNQKPRYAPHAWFQAAGDVAKVPTG